MKLSADLIEAFSGTFLSGTYDEPSPTPPFHRAGWALYCSQAKYAAVAAPRGHAKSTAFTHDYGLAAALFRDEQFIIIVSATEDLAIAHLGDISKELRENDELRQEFGIHSIPIDAKTEIVCRMQDGYEFRFLVRGSGQKMRGLKWRGKRPGLIICDDLEEDEQVENADRRRKFRNWFNRALKPSLRKSGKIRMHGTILHEDALLSRLMRDPTWQTLLYKAHESFDDFSNILWPDRFDEGSLRAIREGLIRQNDAAGYSQEYLNDPHDNSDAYLRKDDFIPMNEDDHETPKMFAVGVDFAISKQQSANRTSFTVGGKDSRNLVHIVDQHVGRWGTLEIMEKLFIIQERWDPDTFFVEDGQIWKAVSPIVYKEMLARDRFLNIVATTPIKDKATRGRAFQRRHSGGGMRYDKEAEWYPPYEAELLRFTGVADAVLDDQFDSTATLMLGFEVKAEVEEDDFDSEEEIYLHENDPRKVLGRNPVTGY